jgi:beta-N-acetylhexosaminidase
VQVDPDVRRLTLSVLLAGFVGPTPPRWLLEALESGLGGVVLFGSNLGDGTAVDKLTGRLRSAAGREVVIALDEEGGDVTRLDTVRGSASPGAAALGYLDDAGATEQAYAAIGARLAAAGVTLDLAPVADVNSDPRNPVIGVRSFGADPELVARHVTAAVRGVQSAGVAACVKHFPGHGATTSDSHHEVATLRRSRAELDAVELPPFRAAIAAGTRAVMTGHLVVPSLDADLATVSRPITTALLRAELGFAGTTVTDALEMRALAGTLGMERGFVAALGAGADTIETGAVEYPDFVATIPQVVQRALDEGSLTRARLEEASLRTAALAVPPPDFDPATRNFGPQLCAPEGLSGDGWRRCVEVVGMVPHLERPLVVECRPPGGMASGDLPWSLAAPLARRLPGTDHVEVHAPDSPLLAAPRRDTPREAPQRGQEGRDVVVVVRDPIRHRWQLEWLERATVVVDVGWPVELPTTAPVVRTRGVAPSLLDAAAQLLAEG